MNPKQEQKIERIPTSIKIDPKVWKKAKIAAINKDMELSLLVEKAIEKWIDLEDDG
jgi:hypothetical protein